jgi:hypothetical protein
MSLSSHSAPGANAGFSYQFERALRWLAQSPAGSIIGIETNDDVAIQRPDKSEVLEQDKHSIRKGATPFGDRSKDLWNTLAIWVDALDNAEVAAETTNFLMVTNKTLPGCIARDIGKAASDAEIDACVAALKKAGEKPPKLIKSQVERVLQKTSRANLRRIIAKCELVDGAQCSSGTALRRETTAQLQLPNWCVSTSDSIIEELLGWLHATALTAWQLNKPAWIKRDYFVNQLHAILDRRKRQITRERAENLIPVSDDKVGETKGNRFVKQIHLVTDDDAIVDNSIRDFIRCNIEKARLSTEGNVTDEDWNAFEAALLARWNKIFPRAIRMNQGKPDEDVGFGVFTDTTETHKEKLAGSDTEQVYLTAGTYHRLADMIRVGWHPRFKELMQKFIKAP